MLGTPSILYVGILYVFFSPECLLQGSETSKCPNWLGEGATGVVTSWKRGLLRVSCTSATASLAQVQQAFGSACTKTPLGTFEVSDPCSRRSGSQFICFLRSLAGGPKRAIVAAGKYSKNASSGFAVFFEFLRNLGSGSGEE